MKLEKRIVRMRLKGASVEEIKEFIDINYTHDLSTQGIYKVIKNNTNEEQRLEIREAIRKKRRAYIIKELAVLAKELGCIPKKKYLQDIVGSFNDDYKALEEESRLEYPQYFKDIQDEDFFTLENHNKLLEDISKYKSFFVTSVVTGCTIDKKALKAVQAYCKAKSK